MAEEVAKSILDMTTPSGTSSLGGKPMPAATQLRSSTARDRVNNAITELEALSTDLATLIKTLQTIKERL